MKKIILGSIMLSSVVLTSCSLTGESKSPEEILKQTQSNVIENMQNNVFSNKQVEFDGSLKVNVESPFGGGNGTISYEGKGSQEKAQVDLDVNGEVDIQGQAGSFGLSSSFLVTLDKIYMKLSKLDAQLPDPSLQAYLAMSQMVMDKWFYVDNQTNSQQFSNNLNNINLQEKFKKHNIFKVDNVIEDKKYEVSLHKDNLTNIAYDLSKEIYPNFTGTKQEILTTMEPINLTGVLSIEGDSYFIFSGNIKDGLQTVPFEVRYLENKIYVKTQDVVLDIDKDGDSFDGTVSMNQEAIKIDIDGKLTQENFELNINYNVAPIKVNANLIYNAKKINNVDLQIPEGAVDLQEMIQQAMGGAMGLPEQQNMPQPNIGE